MYIVLHYNDITGIFLKLGLVSLKGQSPTSYHFSPLYPQSTAGVYSMGNFDLI